MTVDVMIINCFRVSWVLVGPRGCFSRAENLRCHTIDRGHYTHCCSGLSARVQTAAIHANNMTNQWREGCEERGRDRAFQLRPFLLPDANALLSKKSERTNERVKWCERGTVYTEYSGTRDSPIDKDSMP